MEVDAMLKKVNYIAIGRRIRVLRKNIKWSQANLASQCKCSVSFLGHLERATRIPSLETIIKIASLLDVSLDQLILGLDAAPLSLLATARKMRVLNDIRRVLREHIDEWLP